MQAGGRRALTWPRVRLGWMRWLVDLNRTTSSEDTLLFCLTFKPGSVQTRGPSLLPEHGLLSAFLPGWSHDSYLRLTAKIQSKKCEFPQEAKFSTSCKGSFAQDTPNEASLKYLTLVRDNDALCILLEKRILSRPVCWVFPIRVAKIQDGIVSELCSSPYCVRDFH